MSAITPDELLQQWKLENITPEMAIGQLIQNQVSHQELIESCSRALVNVQVMVDSLIAHTGMPSLKQGKRKPPK